ncbi:MAG TPA: tetratricopeptide repeat protein [Polyangia bacterium]
MSACAAPQKQASEPKPVKDVTPLEKQFADQPDDPKVNLELGDRATAGGDWLRAEQYYQRAEALGIPEATLTPRLLRVLVLARRYDEALDRCRKRLSKTPTDRATRLVEAAIYEALERPRDAERELEVLVRTRPEDPNPYLALGKLYRDSYNDAARARQMFAKYLALAPKGDEADGIRYQMEESAPPPDVPPPSPPATSPPATPPQGTTP